MTCTASIATAPQSPSLPPLSPPKNRILKIVCDFFMQHGNEGGASVYQTEGNTKKVFIFVNGMNHTKTEIASIRAIVQNTFPNDSEKGFYQIENNTNGLFNDFCRAGRLWFGKESRASLHLKELLTNLTNTNSIEDITIFCHSEGGLITYAALHHLAQVPGDDNQSVFQKLYPKLTIVSFGSSFLFDQKYAPRTENYLSLIDPIPLILHIYRIFEYCRGVFLLLKEKMEQQNSTIKQNNITLIFPKTFNPFKEHSFFQSYFIHFQKYFQQQLQTK